MGVHVAKQALVGCARFNINCNSGFLCQTWEDPSCSNPDVENAFGDNDPGKRQAVIGEALNGNAKEKKLQFEIGSVTTKFQMGNLPASLALVTKQQISVLLEYAWKVIAKPNEARAKLVKRSVPAGELSLV
ncbi:unnamed protein product [Sphagnum jensenii]|uniref:Uncharacterized protein n=1 Tax=Sphagnum jensenii TaxID=128206 RepID=A0ABP0VVN8_9BRYO